MSVAIKKFVIHTSMAIAEFYLVFFDTEGAPEQNFFDNTTLCWFWKGENVSHSRLMQLFYVVQLSIWIVTCFSHRFVEARHKDYYQMYVTEQQQRRRQRLQPESLILLTTSQ